MKVINTARKSHKDYYSSMYNNKVIDKGGENQNKKNHDNKKEENMNRKKNDNNQNYNNH